MGTFQEGLDSIRARFAAMKSALISTADIWILGWASMDGVWRSWVVRTRGPLALSRMRKGWVFEMGGREGVMRVMRWLARRMLQPPVRWE